MSKKNHQKNLARRARRPKPSEIERMDESAQNLQKLDEAIERQKVQTTSRQPHLIPQKRDDSLMAQFFRSVYRAVKVMNEPPYSSDSRTLDSWLRQFVHAESFLAGFLHTVTIIDQNRAWTLTGGRNQVTRYSNILKRNWRELISKASNSFHSSNMGAVIEIWRDGKNGPLRALNNVDPARCMLTGNVAYPLRYYPATGMPTSSDYQIWEPGDFFRVASMPSTDETLNGLGWCSVNRAVELAQILVAVYEHDKESLGARMPKGLLLLQNITQEQWDQAMEIHKEGLNAYAREYYGGLAIIASMTEAPEAKLVALSQLPVGFDFAKMADYAMMGYAMQFGYDIREFRPWESGTWGTANETATQKLTATTKGGATFVLGFQEQLTRQESTAGANDSFWPDTLVFEWESRDDETDLLEAQVIAAKVGWITKMYESGMQYGQPLLSQEQALTLAVNERIIPPEWTEAVEDVSASDTMSARAILDHPAIIRAQEKLGQPIVRYTFDPSGNTSERMVEIRPRRKRLWNVSRKIGDDQVAAAMRKFEEITPMAGNVLSAK